MRFYVTDLISVNKHYKNYSEHCQIKVFARGFSPNGAKNAVSWLFEALNLGIFGQILSYFWTQNGPIILFDQILLKWLKWPNVTKNILLGDSQCIIILNVAYGYCILENETPKSRMKITSTETTFCFGILSDFLKYWRIKKAWKPPISDKTIEIFLVNKYN